MDTTSVAHSGIQSTTHYCEACGEAYPLVRLTGTDDWYHVGCLPNGWQPANISFKPRKPRKRFCWYRLQFRTVAS